MTAKICIAASADEGYAMPLTVALHSAASCVAPERDVALYVLDAGISPETRQRSEACLKSAHPKVTVHWVIPDLAQFKDFDGRRYTTATFLRLKVPEIVGSDVDRVLYIDCDVVVDDDMSPLWALDLGDAPFAAVANPSGPYFHNRIGARFAEISAPEDAPYFNAGVMLINLDAWRRADISGRALAFLEAHCAELSFLDQDALNAVAVGSWRRLDARWNTQMHRTNRHHKSVGITHYTSHKPWNASYTGARALRFFRAYLNTNWDPTLTALAWVGQRLMQQGLRRNNMRIQRYAGAAPESKHA